jgi:hypothetical protein
MLHSLQYGKYLINCNFISAGALIHDALSKLYCASRKNEIANQIRDLLTEEDAPEKIHIISQYLEMLETNVDCENRQKHEDWFEGMPFVLPLLLLYDKSEIRSIHWEPF